MIEFVSHESFVIPETEFNQKCYGVRFMAQLTSGEVISCPMVWSQSDIDKNTPKQFKELMKTMTENIKDCLEDLAAEKEN